MTKLMSKSELIQKIAEQHANDMTRKDVPTVAYVGAKAIMAMAAIAQAPIVEPNGWYARYRQLFRCRR